MFLNPRLEVSEGLYAKCSCQQCGTHIEFPIEADGVTINCPHCNQPTQLTLAAPPPAHSPDAPSAVDLLAAFAGPVARTPVSFFYQLGLILVSVLMLILPLVYLAMIVVAGYGVYYYATHFALLLDSMSGGGRLYLLKLLAYVTPLFAGTVLVFFMIKPLFARRAPHAQPLAMNPALNPALFAFIAKICDTIGAPMPKRIDLNCDLNAAAGFRRGMFSLLGNDLVLTIGLPLVAGLNLQEFAGVIAHEFGHFTQGFGMRLSYLIRSINSWFARVVYERDAWDVWLTDWAEEAEDWRIMIVVNSARFGVWFSRCLLRLLMLTGHGVSCFLLRQMEYDADSYEIKLAGSETFETSLKRLRVLAEALGRSYREMRANWTTRRRLPDDFPAFLLQQEAALPPEQRTRIEDTVGLATTGLFDSHPSDGDRIRCARRAGESGVFHLTQPAAMLFANFAAVAKQVTILHYTDDIGLDCDPASLRPVNPSTAP
jgi:Zn-dependent protease with chaperone function